MRGDLVMFGLDQMKDQVRCEAILALWSWCGYFLIAEPFSAGFVGTLQHAAFVLEAAEGTSMGWELFVEGSVGGVVGLVVGFGLCLFTKHRSNLLIVIEIGKGGTKMELKIEAF